MVNSFQIFGKNNESLAAIYLKRQGYLIIEQNYRTRMGEIDIIAKEGEMLVIVEVKTRATDVFGEPEMAVNKQKQRSIVKAADAYIQQNDLNIETRFDVVSVIVTPNERRIFHIDDAFYPIM
jgi:putative endonuclease